MTDRNKKILRIAYNTTITIALVLVAMLLMVSCVAIYRTGDFPFTREVVAEHLNRIALPIYVCLGLVAVGIILHPLLPTDTTTNKERGRMTVKRLHRTADLSLCPAETREAIQKEQKARRTQRLIALGLFVAGLAVMLWYALSFERFSMEDINGSFVGFGTVMAPCLGISAAYGVFTLFYNRKSYQREIALYRPVLADIKVAATTQQPNKWEQVVRYAILVAAVALIIGGWAAGGWVDVLTKAINICTECVGLG